MPVHSLEPKPSFQYKASKEFPDCVGSGQSSYLQNAFAGSIPDRSPLVSTMLALPTPIRNAPARRASRLLALPILGLLAACSAPPTFGEDVAIGVGAIPGRSGYDNTVRGIELAIADLNLLPGVRFRMERPDDSAASAVAIAAAHRANPAVIAVVGHPESGQTQLAVPVYAARGTDDRMALAAVSPTASSPALSGISEWFFRVAPSDEAGARDVADFVLDSLKLRSAAVVYRNDAYGRDWARAFADRWRNGDGALLIRDPYLADHTDWTLYARHIAQVDPDVVLFPGDFDDAVRFLRALRLAGARAQFIGGDGTEPLARLPEFAGAHHVSFFQADRVTSAEGVAFLKAWDAAYEEPVDMFGALAYDATIAIGQAVRQAQPRTRGGVRAALATLDIAGVGGRIAFDPATHDVVGRSIVVSTVGRQQP